MNIFDVNLSYLKKSYENKPTEAKWKGDRIQVIKQQKANNYENNKSEEKL